MALPEGGISIGAAITSPEVPAIQVCPFSSECVHERERERAGVCVCVSFKDLSLLSVLFPDAHFPTRRCINFSRFVFSLERERESKKLCRLELKVLRVNSHTTRSNNIIIYS